MVELLNEELDRDVEPEYVENPIPESVYVHDTMADASKMARETGWEPEISFKEGIEQVCALYLWRYSIFRRPDRAEEYEIRI